MSRYPRLSAILAIVGLAGIASAVLPTPALAWWHGSFCCGVGVGIVLPPVVVGAPPVYPPPPVYYAPPTAYYAPQRPWIPPHWEGGYWVPGHWG